MRIILVLKRKRKQIDSAIGQSPYIHRNLQTTKSQHKTASKNIGFTTNIERLMTVSLRYHNHTTSVVKPVDGIPIFPLTANVMLLKGRIQYLFHTGGQKKDYRLICILFHKIE